MEGSFLDRDNSPEVSEDEFGRPAPSCTMVIFGACGDLTKRKLIPALYNLAKSNLLPNNFAIVGGALAAPQTARL